MNIHAGVMIRTLTFIVLALALNGVIVELAGYSALLMFGGHRRRRLPARGWLGDRACAGQCRS